MVDAQVLAIHLAVSSLALSDWKKKLSWKKFLH